MVTYLCPCYTFRHISEECLPDYITSRWWKRLEYKVLHWCSFDFLNVNTEQLYSFKNWFEIV